MWREVGGIKGLKRLLNSAESSLYLIYFISLTLFQMYPGYTHVLTTTAPKALQQLKILFCQHDGNMFASYLITNFPKELRAVDLDVHLLKT